MGCQDSLRARDVRRGVSNFRSRETVLRRHRLSVGTSPDCRRSTQLRLLTISCERPHEANSDYPANEIRDSKLRAWMGQVDRKEIAPPYEHRGLFRIVVHQAGQMEIAGRQLRIRRT